MDKVTITIDTRNDVFKGNNCSELRRILRKIADDWIDGNDVVTQQIIDINGNAVGTIKIK